MNIHLELQNSLSANLLDKSRFSSIRRKLFQPLGSLLTKERETGWERMGGKRRK
jgi:hypothetical protein